MITKSALQFDTTNYARSSWPRSGQATFAGLVDCGFESGVVPSPRTTKDTHSVALPFITSSLVLQGPHTHFSLNTTLSSHMRRRFSPDTRGRSIRV
jgi:hypothetical protein